MPNPQRKKPSGRGASRAQSAKPAVDPDHEPIDPRGPRFGAAVTALLLLVVLLLTLTGAVPAVVVAFGLLVIIAMLFAWGALAGMRRHPYTILFVRAIRPRLAPSKALEDPAPHAFAQGVGFVIAGLGVVLYALTGVVPILAVASALALLAALLNAVFGYCPGCALYRLLARARIIRPTAR